jgi:ligand-binding sensor domain-containing protein
MRKDLLLKYFLLLLWLGGWPMFLLAQTIALNHFNLLTIDEGLPQGYITDVYRDGQDFIWVGTKAGTARYDGERFVKYTHSKDDTTSVSSNNLSDFREDSHGNIWAIAAGKGVSCWLRSKDQFLSFGAVNGLSSDDLLWMEIDKNGIIWMLSMNGLDCAYYTSGGIGVERVLDSGDPTFRFLIGSTDGLGKKPFVSKAPEGEIYLLSDFGISVLKTTYGNVMIEHLSANPKIHDQQGFNSILHFTACHNKRFVFGTSRVFSSYDLKTNLTRHAEIDHGNNIPEVAIQVENTLWLTNKAGLILFDLNTLQSLQYDLSALESKLGLLAVTNIYSDREGLLWIGTSGHGLVLYNPETEGFCHRSGLNERIVSCYKMKQLNESQVLIRTYQQAVVFDIRSNEFIGNYADVFGITKHADLFYNIQDLLIGNDGTTWISKDGQILALRGKGAPEHWESYVPYKSPEFFPLVLSGDTVLWTASNGDLIRMNLSGRNSRLFPFPPEFKISANTFFVHQIYEDDNNLLWIATMDGLLSFDQRQERWRTFQNQNSELNHNIILCITPDSQSRDILWLGTMGGGLCRFNKSNGDCQVFTTFNGLPNDVVYGVLLDQSDRVWCSTNMGISCYDQQLGTFTNFTHRDGLQGNEFNRYAHLKLDDNRFIFGGINGLNIFKPDENIRKKSHKARITDVRLFNKPVYGGEGSIASSPVYMTDSFRLKNTQNTLTFYFSATNYSGNSSYYRYKMGGIDQEWIETDIPMVTYSKLPGGDYIFQVQIKNQDSTWPEDYSSYHVKIEHAIEELNIWKLSSVALAGCSGLFLLLFLRSNKRNGASSLVGN